MRTDTDPARQFDAVVARRLPVAAQLLAYPMVDTDFDRQSYRRDVDLVLSDRELTWSLSVARPWLP